MTPTCPECGEKLMAIIHNGERGVRCKDKLCLFNFSDQSCPVCGKPPIHAKHPELGRYECTCENSHDWNVTN